MTCSGCTDIVRVDSVDAYRMAVPCMHPHCIFDVFCVIGNEDDPIYLGLRF
jgi:hypothetical protein